MTKTKRSLTNPLTCSKCGHVIERGDYMTWKRGALPITAFWRPACAGRKRKTGGEDHDAFLRFYAEERRLAQTSATRARRAGGNSARKVSPQSVLTKTDKRITLAMEAN